MKTFAQFPKICRSIVDVCAGMIAIGTLAMPAVAEETVSAVRFWSLTDVTRVAVEATGPFDFRFDRLVNPDRIFFDFPGTTPAMEHKGVNVIPVSDTFLRQIRIAETQRGTTRVVLDLQT